MDSTWLGGLALWAGCAAAAMAAADAPAGGPALALPEKAHFKLFLLVGQSNMAGRGKVEPQDCQAHPRVLMLNKQGRWAAAVEPMHFDKPAMVGVGPGVAFGKAIAEAYPQDTIGLIPCAFGGTSIDQWKKGSSDPLNLYANAVERGKLAMQQGTLAGILWHQGEGDLSTTGIAAYPAKAAELFKEFRQDMGTGNVPVVVGEIGQFEREGPIREFNTMLHKLPMSIANLGVARSDRLKDKGDQLHFDATSARELGKRYAEAWRTLAEARKLMTSNAYLAGGTLARKYEKIVLPTG